MKYLSLLLLLVSCGSSSGGSGDPGDVFEKLETITVAIEIIDDIRNFQCTEAPTLWYKTEGVDLQGSVINELVGNGTYEHTLETHYEENHDLEIKIIPPSSGNCPGIVARIYYEGAKFCSIAPSYPMIPFLNITTDEIRALVDNEQIIAPDFFMVE